MVRFVHDTLNPQEVDTTLHPQVLALGLPRCATSSLQSALETLGFDPCMHMAHVQPSAERQQLVTTAILHAHDTAQRHKILSRLFAGFTAVADFPSIIFADDLMDLYPDAAIILNTRKGGAQSWHTSFREGLQFFDSWTFWIATFLVQSDRAMMRMMKATDGLLISRWGLTFRDESIYDRHNAWVRAEAAKRGRTVLEFTADDGWAPLCGYLGKPVPVGVAYPRMNDQKNMKMVKRFILARGVLHWVVLVFLVWLLMKLSVGIPYGTLNALVETTKG